MSQFDYYTPDLPIYLPHQRGLYGWGVTFIVCGALAGLMALAVLVAVVAFANQVNPNPTFQSHLAMLQGVLVYVAAAVALIWLGIGSCQGKRWVRPLMIVFCSITTVMGVVMLVTMTRSMVLLIRDPPQVVNHNATPLPFNPMLIGFGMADCFFLVVLEILPIILLWFFARGSVRTTLEQMDPFHRWTDDCPIPVLGWCIACLYLGIGILFSSVKQVHPFFTAVLQGPVASVVEFVIGAVLVVLGIVCYRRQLIAWFLTVLTFFITGLSALIFEFFGDRQRYIDLMLYGFPRDQQQQMRHLISGSQLSPIAIYFVAVLYGLWARKWFVTRAAQ